MAWKNIGLILVLLALMPLVSGFTITYTPINNSITKQETATFAITVVNTKGFDDSFQISTRDPEWLINTEPQLSSIPEQSTKSFVLLVKPKQQVEVGPQAVPIKVKSLRTGKFQEDNLLINIKPDTPFGGEYSPAVSLNVEIDSKVDVRENIPVNIQMDNKNPRDMPNLQVLVNSDIFGKNYEIHLGPLEKKKSELLFEASKYSMPGIHTLNVKLVLNDLSIAQVSKDFEVIAYDEITEEVVKDTSFFKMTKMISLVNTGNMQHEAVKHLKIPFYNKPFVSFDPNPEKVKLEEGRFYQWKAMLAPREQMDVYVTYNYQFLVLALVVIILLVLAYYIFRSPVILIKETVVEAIHENSTVFKVRILVKNRSKKVFRNVVVNDKVPNLAEVYKKTDVGSLKPSKVIASKSKGTSMKWKVDVLEPEEERIITYKMKSKLKIVGGLRLPVARVKFESEAGKERTTYSNRASIEER